MNPFYRATSLILASIWFLASIHCTATTIHTHNGRPASHHHHSYASDHQTNHSKHTDESSCEVCPSEIKAPEIFNFAKLPVNSTVYFVNYFLNLEQRLIESEEIQITENIPYFNLILDSLTASPNSPPVIL